MGGIGADRKLGQLGEFRRPDQCARFLNSSRGDPCIPVPLKGFADQRDQRLVFIEAPPLPAGGIPSIYGKSIETPVTPPSIN